MWQLYGVAKMVIKCTLNKAATAWKMLLVCQNNSVWNFNSNHMYPYTLIYNFSFPNETPSSFIASELVDNGKQTLWMKMKRISFSNLCLPCLPMHVRFWIKFCLFLRWMPAIQNYIANTENVWIFWLIRCDFMAICILPGRRLSPVR